MHHQPGVCVCTTFFQSLQKLAVKVIAAVFPGLGIKELNIEGISRIPEEVCVSVCIRTCIHTYIHTYVHTCLPAAVLTNAVFTSVF